MYFAFKVLSVGSCHRDLGKCRCVAYCLEEGSLVESKPQLGSFVLGLTAAFVLFSDGAEQEQY